MLNLQEKVESKPEKKEKKKSKRKEDEEVEEEDSGGKKVSLSLSDPAFLYFFSAQRREKGLPLSVHTPFFFLFSFFRHERTGGKVSLPLCSPPPVPTMTLLIHTHSLTHSLHTRRYLLVSVRSCQKKEKGKEK